MAVRRLGLVVGIPLVGLLLGLAIAVASSPSSLTRDRSGAISALIPRATALASPTPTVSTPGILGNSARLFTNGANTVIAVGPGFAVGSSDGGHTWTVVRPPANGSELAVDPANPRHAITGGSTIQVTNDGGATWAKPLGSPPGKGPYEPLAISPVEANVWFFIHASRLLVTRDGSSTWTELNVPQVSNAVLIPGPVLGEFFLGSGSRIFQLSNYGQTITELPALSQGNLTELVAIGGTRPALLARIPGRGVFRLDAGNWFSTAGGLNGPLAAGADSAILVGNGGGKLGTVGQVSYSVDGTHWAPAHGLPFDQTVEALAGQQGSNTFFAYCYGGDVYSSSDDGQSWTLLSRFLRSAT